MKSISGAYIKDNKEVKFAVKVPQAWDELDRLQFSRVIEILHFKKADKFTVSVSILALLFGQDNWHVLHHLSENKTNSEDELNGGEMITALIPLTNFVFEDKPSIKNHFPILKINRRKHIAPADDLSNLGFGEWCFAHQYYIYYSLTQDRIWLHKLISVIYRPIDPEQKPDSASYSGDLREKFNENLLEKRALDVAAIEGHMQLAVLSWFSIALAEVQSARPHVFPEVPEIPIDPEQPQEEPDLSRTWLTVFRELLGPKWGTSEQLKFTNAMFILDELEDRHIAFEETKRQN